VAAAAAAVGTFFCSAGNWLSPFSPEVTRPQASSSRREAAALLGGGLFSAAQFGFPAAVRGFTPDDLGMGSMAAPDMSAEVREKSTKELEESVYMISRVQEATVQQERLVVTGKFKDVQRNSIRRAVNMMIDNYKLNDQFIVAAAYIPTKDVLRASTIGNEAVEVLETAKEYFGKDLKVSALSEDQKKFMVDAMAAEREKIEAFLKYLPEEVVAAARGRVEAENALNMKEYALEGQVINPVTLPWKSKKA